MTRRSGKVEKHLKSKEHGILLQSPQSGGERDSLPAGIPDWTPAGREPAVRDETVSRLVWRLWLQASRLV